MPKMTRQKQDLTRFGERLAAIRKGKGITQVELAEKIGTTQRSISYYESATGHAPAPILAKLALALEVSADELLGIKAPRESRAQKNKEAPKNQQLWKRFQLLVQLPERDQKAVMRMINSLASAKGLGKRSRAEATTSR